MCIRGILIFNLNYPINLFTRKKKEKKPTKFKNRNTELTHSPLPSAQMSGRRLSSSGSLCTQQLNLFQGDDTAALLCSDGLDKAE